MKTHGPINDFLIHPSLMYLFNLSFAIFISFIKIILYIMLNIRHVPIQDDRRVQPPFVICSTWT